MRSLVIFLIFLCTSFISFAFSEGPSATFHQWIGQDEPRLKKHYTGKDGASFLVAQRGNTIFWLAEHPGKDYGHVFLGKIEGNMLSGHWWDITKYEARNKGAVEMEILDEGYLLKVLVETGGFPTKILLADLQYNQKAPPQFFTEKNCLLTNTTSDLSGVWRNTSGAVCYVRQARNAVVILYETGQSGQAMVYIGRHTGAWVKGTGAYLPKKEKSGAWNPVIRITGPHQFQFTNGAKHDGANFHRDLPVTQIIANLNG